ncbi:hypothetical protein CNMCM6069_003922 [Aspergillus lentulus]|nr:hypothetical protein CNMCM6069_003922 [Aspergillus lentulus]
MASNTPENSPFPMKGGCACGLIRYRLETQPLIVHCCHCTSCQRETGTAFALNAVIEATRVTLLPSSTPTVPASAESPAKPAGPTITHENPDQIIEPELILTPSESGKGQTIARCPKCLVAIWSNYAGAGPICRFVRVGTLDEAWRVGPDVHIYTRTATPLLPLSVLAHPNLNPNPFTVLRKCTPLLGDIGESEAWFIANLQCNYACRKNGRNVGGCDMAAYTAAGKEVDDEDGEDFDDDVDQDFISADAQPLSTNSDILRQKFLDCVCELLSHTKGGKFVTAAALREKENGVEVDIARNNGLDADDDEEYLDSLKQFLAMQARELPHPALAEYSHTFLKTTITYSRTRVDAQGEAVAQLLRGTLFRPLQRSIAREYTVDTCLLGCCSAPLQPVFTHAESLVVQLLNFDHWSSGQDPSEQRQKMVELAAATVRSPQVTQGALERMLPSVDSHKVIRAWRVLARPLTNLRILSQIARLLPNFRNITFIPISRPAPVKLQSGQVPTIQEAWKSLGLSRGRGPNSGFPPALTGKSNKFRGSCCSELVTHCEIQLLTRYEAEPSLVPRLPYFGCSKKTCFLCESFLELSPLNIRTRGRHGQCHPLWAIQPCDSEDARQRLKHLCKIVKQKIKARRNPRHNPPPVAIQQSSAVSELKSADILEHVRQSKNLEVVAQQARELREKRRILLDPRSVGPPSIWYRDLRTLCVMCQWPCARRCTRCLSSWYCSKRCQSVDWPSHKLLCSRYRNFLASRPSEDHWLGIWFPRDTARPKLIWAPIYSPEWSFHFPSFDPYLGLNHGLLFTIPFVENKRRTLELDHHLTIYYRDYDTVTNKSVHAAVEACPGMSTSYNMLGEYVVMSGQYGSHTGTADHAFKDMTLADFRHALDWFSTCFDETVREIPSGGSSVLAVQVSSPLKQHSSGRNLFTSVAIDRDFPSTSNVSPLSQALGLPIRVCQLDPRADLTDEPSEEETSWTNPYTQILMTEIDPESDNWGNTRRHVDIHGSVLLRRLDEEDLDLATAEHMCFYCLEVLKPLFDKALSGEVSRQDVLDEITLEKATEWKPIDAYTRVTGEQQRPQRGFVRRM